MRTDKKTPTKPTIFKESSASYAAKNETDKHTLDDYYAMPEGWRGELIDGVFYDMTAPHFVHQRIVDEIYYQICSYIRSNQGPCIPMTAPIDVQLNCDDHTMVEPDILILCDHSKIRKWGIFGAPDFILEVISPNTKSKDCVVKLNQYLQAGVKEYWIIDPYKRNLTVHDFTKKQGSVTYSLSGSVPVKLFDGMLAMDLSAVNDLIEAWLIQ